MVGKYCLSLIVARCFLAIRQRNQWKKLYFESQKRFEEIYTIAEAGITKMQQANENTEFWKTDAQKYGCSESGTDRFGNVFSLSLDDCASSRDGYGVQNDVGIYQE